MSIQSDKYKALRTKSVNTLRSLAKKYGYDKLPKNIKNINTYAQRLGNYIEKLQYGNYYDNIPQNTSNKILREWNKKRKELGSVRDVNKYLRDDRNGEFNSLTELNELMWEFKDIKDNVTMKDIKRLAKELDVDTKWVLNTMEEKMASFKLQSYSSIMKFYGFSDKEIKEMAKIFDNANYRKQDAFLKIMSDYAKGMDKYMAQEEPFSDNLNLKDNFQYWFDLKML